MMQELVDEIERTVKDVISSNVHTSMPAKIISYDAESGRATVQPIGSYYYNGMEMPYPEISGVPICSSQMAAGPIRPGDSVMYVCSEQSMAGWSSDTKQDQTDERYELQNGMAIPGLRKESSELQNEANDDNAYVIAIGGCKIKVTEDGITIDAGDNRIEVDPSGDIMMTGKMKISGDLEVQGSVKASGSVTGSNLGNK